MQFALFAFIVVTFACSDTTSTPYPEFTPVVLHEARFEVAHIPNPWVNVVGAQRGHGVLMPNDVPYGEDGEVAQLRSITHSAGVLYIEFEPYQLVKDKRIMFIHEDGGITVLPPSSGVFPTQHQITYHIGQFFGIGDKFVVRFFK